MSKNLLLAAAVAGLALAGYAGAASHGMLPESVDMGLGANARCQRAAVEGDAPAEGGAQRCDRHGKRPGPGPFRVEGDQVQGKWVSFTVDAEGGAIAAFTSRGPFADAVVFDAIALGAPLGEPQQRGPGWMALAGDLRVLAANAPNALLALKNTGEGAATVTFTVADGIAVEALEGNATGVQLTRDGHSAALRTRGGDVSLDGQVVTLTLPPDAGAAFHIEGFPQLLKAEQRALRHHAGPGQRDGPGPRGGPLPPEAGAPVGA